MAVGDYELLLDVPFQVVASLPRRYGVMFNPASSRSRLRIVDGGRRYEVQLTDDGVVQYRIEDGAPWQPIVPRPDSITGKPPPQFLSYDQKRAGEALAPVRFDMIAVGRGRILAKEAGKDRIFHLVMDELFRTHQRQEPNPEYANQLRSAIRTLLQTITGQPVVLEDPRVDAVRNDLERYGTSGASVMQSLGGLLPGLIPQLNPSGLLPFLQNDLGRYGTSGASFMQSLGGLLPGFIPQPQLDPKALLVLLNALKSFLEVVSTLSPFRLVGSEQATPRAQDPAVPGAYLKLDPEFFGAAAPSLVVPPEAERDYASHPASLRFPAFAELLRNGIADLALVPQQPRVWYLLDARSPLTIIGPEDFRFTETDLQAVFDRAAVGRVVQGFYTEKTRTKIRDAADQQLTQVAQDIANQVVLALPKWPFVDKPVFDVKADDVRTAIVTAVKPGILDAVDVAVGKVLAWVADELAKGIQQGGFGGVLLPANAALLLGLYELQNSGALVVDKRPDGGAVTRLNIGKALEALPANQALSDAMSDLFSLGRKRVPSDPTHRNPPPAWMPVYRHLRYRRRSDGREEPRHAIAFSKVLDLGVGYSHWTEHWQTHLGGEIQSLLATRPLFQQERYNLTQYRLLNGPVIDGDAYNDGTCNFYMLVKLGAPGTDGAGLRQRYAILWIDEQSYFTQRWRLVHPTDDVMGDLFSLQRTLADNPEWFQFSKETFWSPFVDDLIDDDSRMAVRRQIIAVTGYDRRTSRREIYTLCFNYGTCDHTWRWRPFPAGEHVLVDAASAQAREPTLPDDALHGPKDAYVYVNTLDLRDDTTLHVKGTLRVGPDDSLVPGRWVQRYLPADSRHVPRPHQLTKAKPASGFSHPWDFVSEEAYGRADRYYQLGVFAEVESRCQYYVVDLLPGPDGTTPSLDDVTSSVWQNDASAGDLPPLRHDTVNFDWSLPRDANGYITLAASAQGRPTSALFRDRLGLPTMSMYEPTTRFRILQRAPLGTIAVFYDKRDDELQSASHLPQEVIFQESLEHETIPDAWADEQGGTACGPSPRSDRKIRLLVKGNRRVIQPPVVRKARVAFEDVGGKVSLRVSFWTPQASQDVAENIWKVTLAALEEDGTVVRIFEQPRFPCFVRAAEPAAPLPLDFDGALGDAWKYEWCWEVPGDQAERVHAYCSRLGHIHHATSLWFEDVVGHCATAEETLWE